MAVFAKSYFFLYNSAGKFWNKTAMTSLVLVTIHAGERPRTAAFGSGPRPVLRSANGLRPVLKIELVRLSTIKNGRACQRWDKLVFKVLPTT